MRTEYARRRDRLMEKIGDGVAVFCSAPPAVNHNDVEYVYRQDSDFYYLTGFTEPDAVAVLAPKHPEHRFILFVRPRDPKAEVWTGRRAGVEGATADYGADIAYPIHELDEKLPSYLEASHPLYYSLGRNETMNQKLLSVWQRLLATYPKRGRGPTAIADAGLLLAPLRLQKTPGELEKIRRAIAISADAHNHAHQSTQPGMYEYEIEAQLNWDFRKAGAMGPAYPSIVAAGANACVLHYIDNNCQMQDGDLLLIDAGCCYDYYNADITRTFPVSGRFTAEQRTIYELVLEAQQAAIAQVFPGNPYNAPHQAAVTTIVSGLRDLGLLSGSLDELLADALLDTQDPKVEMAKKFKPFFMHGTGHYLGIDVHDVGLYRAGDAWTTLQPGTLVTVEPGIYIAPDIQPAEGQPEIPDRWKGIGVRIEDDVLVVDGPEGHEILTGSVPKSVTDMERDR